MIYPNRVIAVDVETLGLNPLYDALTSIACVVFDDGEPTGEAFFRAVRPSLKSTKLNMEAFEVQAGVENSDGTLDRDKLAKEIARIFSDDAVTPKQVMADLAEWCRGIDAFATPCVAHRAAFDLGFYDQKLASNTTVYRQALSPTWICTKTMARAAQLKGCSKFSLQETATLLGIPHDRKDCHEARYDAELAGRVYFGLRALLQAPTLEVVTA